MPKPGSTTQRDYGAAHQRMRKAMLPSMPGSPCTRCGRTLQAGDDVHLDHDDQDRGKYLGFAHARCNLVAGAVKGNRARAPFVRPIR